MDFLTDQDLCSIEWLFRHDPESVLFIFDGLDEYNLSSSKAVTDILKAVIHPEVRYILTSRGEGISKTKGWKMALDIEAELNGFDKQHIIKYVNKFFKGREGGQKIAEALLKRILPSAGHLLLISKLPGRTFQHSKKYKDTEDLFLMAKNPGRLCMMCLLWVENRTISANRQEFYEAFIRLILSRSEQRENPSNDSRTHFSDLIQKYHDVLIKFGQMANKREPNGQMSIVFAMQDAVSVVGADVMKYGLLFKSHPVSRLSLCQVSFIHKTLQEFLISYYLTNDENVSELKTLFRFCLNNDGFEQEASLLRFVCQMAPSKFVSEFLTCFTEYSTPKYALAQLQEWCFKHLDDPQLLADALEENATDKVTLDFSNTKLSGGRLESVCNVSSLLKKPTHLMLGNCMLTREDVSTVTKLGCIFSHVCFLDLSGNDLTGAGTHLANLFLLMPNCKVIDISHTFTKIVEISAMNDVLSCKKLEAKIESLNMTGNVLDCYSDENLLILLKFITLMPAKFIKTDPAYASTNNRWSQKTIPPCEKINLSKIDLFQGGFDLGKSVATISDGNCKYLSLNNCGIKKENMNVLCESLKDQTFELHEIQLNHNVLTSAGEALGKFILESKHCTKLKCESCGLTEDDLKDVADILSQSKELPKLQGIDMSENNLSTAGREVARLINLLPSYENVKLKRCCLAKTFLDDFKGNLVTGAEKLKSLVFASNDFSGSGDLLVSCICKQVTYLDFSNCQLGRTELDALAKSPYIQMWTWLDLNKNHFQGAGTSLGILLSKLPLGAHFDVSECRFDKSDITNCAQVMEACKIRFFWAEGNNFAGSGADLAKVLSNMTENVTIAFNSCGIVNEDLKEMATYFLSHTKPNILTIYMRDNEMTDFANLLILHRRLCDNIEYSVSVKFETGD